MKIDFPFQLSLGSPAVKNLPVNTGHARDTGSISGVGRSPGEGNGNSLQHSCLGNLIDREDWRATVRGGHKELDMSEHTYTHTHTHTEQNYN